MSTFKRFEDIKAWQLARDLTKLIYNLTKDREFSKDYNFVSQIRRSAVSVMSNIAEGFERYTKKEFVQFLIIAKASAGETRSHLYAALDAKYITEEEFIKAKELCEVVSKHIWNLTNYLKKEITNT